MAAISGNGDKSSAAPTNPRGIPYAPFVDRVEDYASSRADVEGTLKSFQEMISKYQFMQVNTQRRAQGLKDKIPDISKTLETVRFLRLRSGKAAAAPGGDGDAEAAAAAAAEPLETTFELNDTLYARALVPPTREVYLWLGANVMLAYPLDEAAELLEGKLDTASRSLAHCEEDLDFLREQITTMEVATARVYNWDVQQRRKERLESEAEGKGNGSTNGKDGKETNG